MSKRRVFVSHDEQLVKVRLLAERRLKEYQEREGELPESLRESINSVQALRQQLDLSWKAKATVVEVKPYGVAVVPWSLIFGASKWGEKPNDALYLTMPDIGQKLLPFILPKKLREAMEGDLAEDFRKYATKWGRLYALAWLWWELGGLCIRRFGPTAFITAIGALLRQKLGL
jgi:hypothetical protein